MMEYDIINEEPLIHKAVINSPSLSQPRLQAQQHPAEGSFGERGGERFVRFREVLYSLLIANLSLEPISSRFLVNLG